MIKQLFEAPDKRHIPDDTILWRYVPIRTLFFYLQKDLFLPSIKTLQRGDPFEGRLNNRTLAAFHKALFRDRTNEERQRIREWLGGRIQESLKASNPETDDEHEHYADILRMSSYFEFISDTRYAWCWFRSKHESALMWNVYGRHGVAIKTTLRALKCALATTDREFTAAGMTYVEMRGRKPKLSSQQKVENTLILHPYLLKRKEYSSEREVRIITTAPKRPRNGAGLFVHGIDPQSWILALRFWPELTFEEEQALKRPIVQTIPDCRRSDLLEWKIDLRRCLEKGGSDYRGPAEPNWSILDDGIPEALKHV